MTHALTAPKERPIRGRQRLFLIVAGVAGAIVVAGIGGVLMLVR